MISKQHKTIFVHIPKVAGQSIETMFLNDLGLSWDERSELLLRKKNPDEKGPERLAHLRARDYVELGYLSAEEFEEYFKFTFVRNPNKRTFSFYNFLGYSRIMSFRSFVFKVLPQKLKEDDFFFRSQYDYLYDDEGNLMVDFVGRLETIKADIEEVKKNAGIPGADLPHVNKSIGEWNRGLSLVLKNPSYVGFYTSGQRGKPYDEVITPEILKKIEELYQKDFEFFNYDVSN